MANGPRNKTQRKQFMVSTERGDTAGVLFIGNSVQVFGNIDPLGLNATFGLDVDVSEGGGVTCKARQVAINRQIPIFDSGSLPLGLHTLLVTNNGLPLSLASFNVLRSSETVTSTSKLPISLPSAATSSSRITIVTPAPNSASSTPNSASHGAGASLSFTILTLPPPPLSLSLPGTPSLIRSSSSGVSGLTEVEITGGTTATIPILTSVGVPPSQGSHQLSQGVLAGAVVGGVVPLFLLVGVGLWWRRRRIRVRSLSTTKETALSQDPESDLTRSDDATIAIATKLVPDAGRLAVQPSEGPVGADGSLAAPHASPVDGPPSSPELEGDGRDPSSPAAPDRSSAIPEPSSGTDGDGPSGADTNADFALAHPQAVVNGADSKEDTSESTAGNVGMQPAPPSSDSEGNALDTVTPAGIGGEPSVPRAGARTRRLRVEGDSGVRLAGGRLGETRGEGVESGEWEVLPPPYQEF